MTHHLFVHVIQPRDAHRFGNGRCVHVHVAKFTGSQWRAGYIAIGRRRRVECQEKAVHLSYEVDLF